MFDQIHHIWREQNATEIRIDVPNADPRQLSGFLTQHGCRLACMFAEDRGGRYNIHYVFDHPEDTRYLIASMPVSADTLAFPSLAVEIPAVNWQEREIQDM